MTREILTQGQEIVEELDKLFKMQDDWNDAIKLNQISLQKVGILRKIM